MTDYGSLRSVCFVFLQGIGDFVMFTPSLMKIKKINPGINVTVVLRKELGMLRLARELDFIDEVLELSLDTHPRIYVPWIFWTYEYWVIKKRLRQVLAGRVFDMVKVVLTQIFPTITYMLLAPSRIKRHKTVRFASEVGLTLTDEEMHAPRLRIPQDVNDEAARLLGSLCDIGNTAVVGIQRNTLDATKFISLKETQRFIDELNNRSRGSGGEPFFLVFADDRSYALEEEIDGGHLDAPNLRYTNRLGRPVDVLMMSALLGLCTRVVAIDSACSNIAGALGVGSVVVFNTYKFRPEHFALRKDNILTIDKRDTSARDLVEKYDELGAGGGGGGGYAEA